MRYIVKISCPFSGSLVHLINCKKDVEDLILMLKESVSYINSIKLYALTPSIIYEGVLVCNVLDRIDNYLRDRVHLYTIINDKSLFSRLCYPSYKSINLSHRLLLLEEAMVYHWYRDLKNTPITLLRLNKGNLLYEEQ